jgi:hypothetical protein
MLEKLLSEIKNGGTLQPATLGQRLGLSTAMVEAMIADLERMGLLQRVDTACSHDACGGCSLSSGCVTQGDRGRLWMLSKKV